MPKKLNSKIVFAFTNCFVFLMLFFFMALPVVSKGNNGERKPLIGINMDVNSTARLHYRILPDYVKAVLNAGGIPVMIPPMPEEELPEVLSHLDGVLMIGGNDYPPELYGEKPHPSVVKMEEERSRFDLALARAALRDKRLPLLGICAGCQALNIVSGGSLVQDIPTQVKNPRIHSRDALPARIRNLRIGETGISPQTGSGAPVVINGDTAASSTNSADCPEGCDEQAGSTTQVQSTEGQGTAHQVQCTKVQDSPQGHGTTSVQDTTQTQGGTSVQSATQGQGTARATEVQINPRNVMVKHEVRLEPNTKLAKIMNVQRLKVVTSHHQSVKDVGKDLKVAARALDGVIESIESEDKDFAIGVQWHPERDYQTCEPLFRAFIKQAQKAQKERLLAGND